MFYYRSIPDKIETTHKPDYPTVHGVKISPDSLALAHPDYPNETELQRARRLDILDEWMPVWEAVLSNGHRIEYTWKKARTMNDAWNLRIFSKQKNLCKTKTKSSKQSKDS